MPMQGRYQPRAHALMVRFRSGSADGTATFLAARKEMSGNEKVTGMNAGGKQETSVLLGEKR